VTTCRRETLDLLAAILPIYRSRALAGIARGSYYRSLAGPAEREPVPRPAPPNKLTDAEREELIIALNSARFVDKAPRQVWAALLDEGAYLASVSTMYRLLRERDQVRERRAQARHEALPDRPRPQRDLQLGHHQAARPRRPAVLRPLRHDRHLLPVRRALGDPPA